MLYSACKSKKNIQVPAFNAQWKKAFHIVVKNQKPPFFCL